MKILEKIPPFPHQKQFFHPLNPPKIITLSRHMKLQKLHVSWRGWIEQVQNSTRFRPIESEVQSKTGLNDYLSLYLDTTYARSFDNLGSVNKQDKLKDLCPIHMIRTSLYGRQKRKVNTWTHIEKVGVIYQICVIRVKRNIKEKDLFKYSC